MIRMRKASLGERTLWEQSPVMFPRIYGPWKYATSVDEIYTVSFEQLQQA